MSYIATFIGGVMVGVIMMCLCVAASSNDRDK